MRATLRRRCGAKPSFFIVCPLWLLLFIFFAIFLIIFKILWGKNKARKD